MWLHHFYSVLVWHWALASLSSSLSPRSFSWLGVKGLKTVLSRTRHCPQTWYSGLTLKQRTRVGVLPRRDIPLLLLGRGPSLCLSALCPFLFNALLFFFCLFFFFYFAFCFCLCSHRQTRQSKFEHFFSFFFCLSHTFMQRSFKMNADHWNDTAFEHFCWIHAPNKQGAAYYQTNCYLLYRRFMRRVCTC